MRSTCATRAFAVMISATLATSVVPTTAYAVSSSELQAQLNEAQSTLQSLAEQTAAAGEALNDTLYELEQTKGQIDETTIEIEAKQAELVEAQEVLSERISSNYKAGGGSLLSFVLDSTTFEDFVSSVYYADKVASRDADAIQTVKEVRAELDEKRESLAQLESEQAALAEQQEAQKAALQQQQAAQADYVSGLSAELQAKIEEERQAEIARQEAARKAAEEEAARRAAEEEQGQATPTDDTSSGSDSSGSDASTNTNSTPAPTTSPSTSSGGSSGSTGGGGTSRPSVSGSSARQTIVNAAYSQLGVPYIYGTSNPGVSFDCSGLTSWCYAQAGISIPHSSAGQAGYISSTGNLQPGDLVIWLGGVASGSGNHVALYVGNDTIIHANGSYVTTDSLSGRSAYTIAGSVL